MSLADLHKAEKLKNGDSVIDTQTKTLVNISNIETIPDYGIFYYIGNTKYGSEYKNNYSMPERFIGVDKMGNGRGGKKSKKQRNSKRRRTHHRNRLSRRK